MEGKAANKSSWTSKICCEKLVLRPTTDLWDRAWDRPQSCPNGEDKKQGNSPSTADFCHEGYSQEANSLALLSSPHTCWRRLRWRIPNGTGWLRDGVMKGYHSIHHATVLRKPLSSLDSRRTWHESMTSWRWGMLWLGQNRAIRAGRRKIPLKNMCYNDQDNILENILYS